MRRSKGSRHSVMMKQDVPVVNGAAGEKIEKVLVHTGPIFSTQPTYTENRLHGEVKPVELAT